MPERTEQISALNHREPPVAARIHAILFAAYRVEAALLQAEVFPPLSRTRGDVRRSANEFFGYLARRRIVGILELEAGGASGAPVTIAALGVEPGYFRRGIGRALVRFALARVNGAVRVTTGAGNEPALALYRQFGFRVVGRSRSAHGIELVDLEYHSGIERV